MERRQSVVRVDIVDFVNMEEWTCPKSRQNSDNSEQPCGRPHKHVGSYTALPITALFMTKTSDIFRLLPPNR